MKQFTLNPFQKSDVSILTPIMTRAFDADSQKALGRNGGPPGYSDGSFLRKWAFEPGATAFRIDVEGIPAGCAIIWLHPESNSNFLGCLFLDVPFQGIGVGTGVWNWLESHYPAKTWNVETPAFSRTNHHFYINKCGFEVYRIDHPKGPEMSMYQMHKIKRDDAEQTSTDVHAVRILEIADCKMVSSGRCMIGDETFSRFDRWMSAQPRRTFPADFLFRDKTGFHWLYQAEMADELPSDFPVIDFHGGLYAVVTGVDRKTDISAVDTAIDEFIARNGFVRDPTRPGLGNVITPPAAMSVMGSHQMDYYFPISPKQKDGKG